MKKDKLINIKELQKVPVQHFDHNVPENPLVSVSVLTYQHVNYIKECLDSILMQKTNFDFEILVGEDESTDGTREICIEYAKKHPDKIRLFLHKRENVIHINNKPTGRFNMLYNLNEARGKYIALCEGDDYWTDPLKLFKQIKFLEENKEFTICHHKMLMINEDESIPDKITNVNTPEITTIKNLAKQNYIYTASCIYRKGLFSNFPDWFISSPIGDYVLHMLNAKHGKIKMFNEIMGVYRIHSTGLWENRPIISKIEDLTWVIEQLIQTNEFNKNIIEILTQQLVQLLLYLLNYYNNENKNESKKQILLKSLHKYNKKIVLDNSGNYKLSLSQKLIDKIIRKLNV